MLTKTNIETTTYDCPYLENLKIDITKNGNNLEAWIYHPNFGVKSLMFGTELGSDTGVLSESGFLGLVESNALIYAKSYIEDVMEGE